VEVIKESGGITPFILPHTASDGVISELDASSLCTWGKTLRYVSSRSVGGSQKRSFRYRDDVKLPFEP
jgi:hypothetical protein